METTAVKLYSTGSREAKPYLAAALFVAGNIVLPQICHLVPPGGLRWSPLPGLSRRLWIKPAFFTNGMIAIALLPLWRLY